MNDVADPRPEQEQAIDALCALSESVPALGSAWRTMASAPKDGTKILGYKWALAMSGFNHEYPARHEIRIVYWQEYSRDKYEPVEGNLCRKVEQKYFSGWLSAGSGWNAAPNDWAPTRWMPLPDPPSHAR